MTTVKDPKSGKPVLHKRKAVKNLKDLKERASSSSNHFFDAGKTSATTTSSEKATSSKDPFQYESLKDNIGKIMNNYFFYSLAAYIYFRYDSDNKENSAGEAVSDKRPINATRSVSDKRSIFAAQKQETGWKLHISVDSAQLSLAWEIIYPILLKNKISAKILDPDVLKRNATEDVSSKQLTIYQFKNKHIDSQTWSNVLQEIDHTLRQHGIGRGILPPADKQITNSDYFSYRNDADPTGKYISDGAAKRYADLHIHEDSQLVSYNLIKDKDPFSEVRLLADEEDNQLTSRV